MKPTPARSATHPELLTPDHYPALATVSAAFFFKLVVVPRTPPPPPQYVYVPVARVTDPGFVALALWNFMWEWGTVRPESEREGLPERVVAFLDRHPEENFRLVPFTGEQDRLACYDPLYALLPWGTLERFGLPQRRTTWPMIAPAWHRCQVAGGVDRLSAALAHHLWPLLGARSAQSALSKREPTRVLAHHLDFWLPYADVVVQRRMKARGRVPFEGEQQRRDQEELQRVVDLELDADACRPCYGGHAWYGEEEALEAAREMVEVADEGGRLRGLLEAVRANRVEDDFSPRWSHLREDFERKLYRKRSKWRVAFVELDDTVPVHAPDVEVDVERRLLWQILFATLNEKERRIVVCLRNGTTTATDIAAELGYANHSPISKALAAIRRKARRYFE